MIIYDISRSIPDTKPFEGDPETKLETISSIDDGDIYNLSAFSMSAHTATHIDAPFPSD
jgi:arylformamidase